MYSNLQDVRRRLSLCSVFASARLPAFNQHVPHIHCTLMHCAAVWQGTRHLLLLARLFPRILCPPA